MFTITVEYETGNSFGSSTESEAVGHVWKNIDAAIESLKRIREHGKWTNEGAKDTQRKKAWFVGSKESYQNEYAVICVDDKMNPIKLSAFWAGYFEKFYDAKIEVDA